MKKNLLQPETRKEILSRLDGLTPESKGKWGRMNVNQMLWHTNHGLQIALGEVTTPSSKANVLTKTFMRFVILNTNIPAPEGKAKTFDEIDTVELGINPSDFQAEREQLKNTINRFVGATKVAPESALIGKMSKENWGRLNYGHFDHHFRQFGA
ncbi:MAG: hypothetical protein ABI778_03695 [Ignavibacteriota bacterium]